MATTDTLDGAWITKISGKLFFFNFSGKTFKFFAPPPELEGRPTAFPEGAPGPIGQNLYLVLRRAA
jgi:hypothetical protein